MVSYQFAFASQTIALGYVMFAILCLLISILKCTAIEIVKNTAVGINRTGSCMCVPVLDSYFFTYQITKYTTPPTSDR